MVCLALVGQFWLLSLNLAFNHLILNPYCCRNLKADDRTTKLEDYWGQAAFSWPATNVNQHCSLALRALALNLQLTNRLISKRTFL